MPAVENSHGKAVYYKPQQGDFWVSATEDDPKAVERTTYNKDGVAKKHLVRVYSAINAKLDSFVIRKISNDKGDFQTLDVRFDTMGEVEIITMPWPSDQAKNMLLHLAVMEPGTMYHLSYYDIPKEKTEQKKRAVRGFKIQTIGMGPDEFIKRLDTRETPSYPKADEAGEGQRAHLDDKSYWKVFFVIETAYLENTFIPKLTKSYEAKKKAAKEEEAKLGPAPIMTGPDDLPEYDANAVGNIPPVSGDDLPF